MLRQQLQETKETLAARDAEVNELKARVAELEKLQQQQQQLLTLKDSALATAQQTLAKSNAAAAAPTPPKPAPSTQAVTPAPVASTQAATTTPPQAQGSGFWMWGGLALLVAATIGWLLTRKRHASTAAPKRSFDTEALAASIPVARSESDVADAGEGVGFNAEFMPDQLIAPRPMQAPRTARVPVTEVAAPPWHGDVHAEAVTPAATLVSPNAQLALAQACLDRGDDDAARVLLLEVMDGRDPAARDVAARLLRDL
jgi:pilus assembly protein FimV